MLESDHHEQQVARWINALPCQVNLPQKLRDNFEKSGASPAVADEVRSGMRVHCRGDANRAALELRTNLRAFPRETQWQAVYASNISKKGCGFIHSQNLYPGERFTLVLLTGLKRVIEVVWCRRLDENCFEVGSRFADAGPA